MQMLSPLASELFLQAGLTDRFHIVNVPRLQKVEQGERPVIRVLELLQLMLQYFHGPARQHCLVQIIQYRYRFQLKQPSLVAHLLILKRFHETYRLMVW